MPIKWTKARRKTLNGVRTAHRFDPSDAVPDSAAAFERLRARFEASAAWATIDGTPATQPLLDQLTAGYAPGAGPPTTLDPELELLRMAIDWHLRFAGEKDRTDECLRTLCALWLGVGGMPAVLAIFEHVASFGITGAWSSEAAEIQVVPPSSGGGPGWAFSVHSAGYAHIFWRALRTQVFGLDDKSYATAMAAAAPMRAGLDPSDGAAFGLRTRLDYVFSRPPVWAEQDVRRLLGRIDMGERVASGDGHLLLASMTDPDLAERFAQAQAQLFAVDLAPYVDDLVEGLGPAAAGVLATVIERGQRYRLPGGDKKKLSAGIKLARTGA